MLRGNWEQNTLSRTFFSPENIKIIEQVVDESKSQAHIVAIENILNKIEKDINVNQMYYKWKLIYLITQQ